MLLLNLQMIIYDITIIYTYKELYLDRDELLMFYSITRKR